MTKNPKQDNEETTPLEFLEKQTTQINLTLPSNTTSLASYKKDNNFQGKKNQSNNNSRPWWQTFHVYSYVILGGFDTIISKYQYTTKINNTNFEHPFISTFLMFVSMSIPFYWVLYKQYRGTLHLDIDPNKKLLSSFKDYALVLIPCLFDLIGSTLQFFSLLFVDSSIYQMMRGGSIIFTAIFSKWIFKKIFQKYHYFGLFAVICGLIIVGLSNFLFIDSSTKDSNTQLICIGLLCICMALNGGHYTSEEYIYSKYNIHPCNLLGLEAFYGKIIYCLMLVMFCNLECNLPNHQGCVKVGDKYYFESVSVFIDGIKQNGWLLTFVIFGLFSKCIYNLNGVTTTRYFSSLTRSVAGALRTLVIWIIGLIVTAAGARQWESLDTKTNCLKAAGYLVLFLGNLIYNGVIRIPCFPEIDRNRIKQISVDGIQLENIISEDKTPSTSTQIKDKPLIINIQNETEQKDIEQVALKQQNQQITIQSVEQKPIPAILAK